MKRLIVILAILGMASTPGISNACAVSAFFQGLLSSAPVDFVCQPTPAQQQTAAQMLAALDAAQLIGATFYPVLGIAQASAVLTTLKNGGCFAVQQLRAAFEAVDAANAAVQAKQMKMLKGAPATLPEYPDLRVYVQ
jgi:hypothetical protein